MQEQEIPHTEDTPQEIIKEDNLSDATENASTATSEQPTEDFKSQYIRLYAEFDNFRKRTQKEKTEWIQFAGKEIMVSMIEVLEDMLRAEEQLQHANDASFDAVKKGIQLVFDKFKKNLKQKGLEPMDSIGKVFDVSLHEAISEVEVDDETKKGTVIAEMQKGYLLNGKAIQFAKVVVGK